MSAVATTAVAPLPDRGHRERPQLHAVPSAVEPSAAARPPRWQRWAAAIGTAQPGGGMAQLLIMEGGDRRARR
jgi:hypothetical protein